MRRILPPHPKAMDDEQSSCASAGRFVRFETPNRLNRSIIVDRLSRSIYTALHKILTPRRWLQTPTLAPSLSHPQPPRLVPNGYHMPVLNLGASCQMSPGRNGPTTRRPTGPKYIQAGRRDRSTAGTYRIGDDRRFTGIHPNPTLDRLGSPLDVRKRRRANTQIGR